MSSADWDLLLVTDATASMGTYLQALASSIPEILALGSLSGAFKRVGLLAYTDYSEGPEVKDVVDFFGWDNPNIAKEAHRLEPRGGGDVPEACKTALVEVIKQVDANRKTLVVWYADAGPHHSTNSNNYRSNGPKEIKALGDQQSDWVKLSQQARLKNCTIFPIVEQGLAQAPLRFFVLMAALTNGMVFNTPATNSEEVSRLTLDLLLAWMGQPIAPAKYKTETIRFQVSPFQATPAVIDEEQGSQGYLPSKNKQLKLKPMDTIRLATLEDAQFDVSTTLPNLSAKFLDPNEKAYRDTVHRALNQIITSNVVALTYNSVFGQLWRAVCKNRNDPRRDDLVNAFSEQVGKEKDLDRRQMLTEWLEESYNSAAEIQEMIDAAPDAGDPNQRRIYLDLDSGVNLTRTELLEVARSLYPGVLQKLASILTHIKIVEKDVKLLPSQRSIPLSLSPFDLFKVLPHLVVEGTMFSGRAAALFAALSMVVGVRFLDAPARVLLSQQQGTWLNIEIPENLSYECAKLLLKGSVPDVALTEEERNVYTGMRRYRLIELNLKASLTASIPWTPEKTGGVGDRQLVCKKCSKRRSVTIMAPNNTCGFCAYEQGRLDAIANHVKGAKDWPVVHDEPELSEDKVRWVECGVSTCRAQYVVLNPHQLNVRPKCHFCRHDMPCPWVACAKCTNRIIVPEEYRVAGDQPFTCFACNSGKSTIVQEDTNTLALMEENGRAWLGFDASHDLFRNSSAFKLFSKHGASAFTGVPTEHELMFHSKKVFNADVLRLRIEGRVESGEVEKGTCSLCFDDTHYHNLLPACGRTGCKQQADDACLEQWYGGNQPGILLNPLQLRCPFCRRTPVTKTLQKYNPRALAVGDLTAALEDRAWYYAWCVTCGCAKQAVERACADAGLPVIKDFICEGCREQAAMLQARLQAEAEALRAAGNLARLEAVNRQLQVVRQNKLIKITPCPECGVYVEKTFGCNHITCKCGTHFCFIDGLKFSANTIYAHLANDHGGYGDYEDGDDDEDDGY